MSWTISGSEKRDVAGINNVSLLLHGDGANGSTTITDSSPSPKTVTAVGNAQISTAQSKFGGASIAFDGTGDYLTFSNESDFNLSIGDFTIEAWVYPAVSKAAMAVFAKRDSVDNYRVTIDSGTLVFNCWTNNGSNAAASLAGGSVSLNTWSHIAVIRSGSSFISFLNGVSQATASFSGAFTNTATVGAAVGRELWTTTRDFNGYIDELRITKGIARYTANFTPPTAPFPDI